MHDYIKRLYDEASTSGYPLIRTLFFEFPDDPKCWEIEDQYLFGPDYLVAPILELNRFERSVYLPSGASWELTSTGECFEGGQTILVAAPLEYMPVFHKVG